MAKLYALTIATEQDIPTTMPMRTPPFDEWRRYWFENPGVREDRFWIAREGDAMVGLSVIGYPPARGVPWTFFTATSRNVRGRGLARALKYATLAQAIALGAERVRTSNDGENAPILHLNDEMGYRLVDPVIELHRELDS
jgi:RimJ/RimL family protein N-acetyltransferase